MPTTKTTITITDLQDAAGNLLGNAWLTVRLNAGPNGGVVDGAVIATPAKVQTDADGDASIQLYPNSAITPADSYYTISVDESSPLIYRTIEVPSGGGTYAWTADAIQVEAVPFDGPYPGGTTGSAGQVVARKSSGNGFELVNHNSIAGRSTADAHPMAAVSATGLTVPKASTIVAEWEATAPAFGASSERIAAMSAVLPLYVTRDGSTAAAAAQDQHAFGLLALAEAEGARTDLAELADTDVTVADPPALFDPTNAVAAWESMAGPLGITTETTDQVSTLIDSALTLHGRTVDHQDDVNENAGVVGLIGLYVGAQALDDAAAAGGGSVTIDAIASATHGATSKTTPVDGDELLLVDSAASNAGKKLSWANLKATLAPSDIGAVPTSRTFAGLDLSADRTVAAVLAALGIWMPWRAITGRYTHAIQRTGAGSHAASRCWYLPIFLPVAVTVDRIAVYHEATTSTSGGYRLGLYSSTSTGMPGSLLVDGGVCDCSTAAGSLKTVTVSQSVGPGLFYVAAAQQVTGSSPSVSQGNPVHLMPSTDNTSNGFLFEAGVSSGLPSTATPASTTASQAPVVSIRIA